MPLIASAIRPDQLLTDNSREEVDIDHVLFNMTVWGGFSLAPFRYHALLGCVFVLRLQESIGQNDGGTGMGVYRCSGAKQPLMFTTCSGLSQRASLAWSLGQGLETIDRITARPLLLMWAPLSWGNAALVYGQDLAVCAPLSSSGPTQSQNPL